MYQSLQYIWWRKYSPTDLSSSVVGLGDFGGWLDCLGYEGLKPARLA